MRPYIQLRTKRLTTIPCPRTHPFHELGSQAVNCVWCPASPAAAIIRGAVGPAATCCHRCALSTAAAASATAAATLKPSRTPHAPRDTHRRLSQRLCGADHIARRLGGGGRHTVLQGCHLALEHIMAPLDVIQLLQQLMYLRIPAASLSAAALSTIQE